MPFCDLVISLNSFASSIIHSVAGAGIFFLVNAEWYFNCLSIHVWVNVRVAYTPWLLCIVAVNKTSFCFL